MSAIQLQRIQPSRPAPVRTLSVARQAASPKRKMSLVGMVSFGALVIALANLLLYIMSSTSVYELAHLQAQQAELTTTSNILSEEVDSLSSQQNLANSAGQLGMISNANPVFINIEQKKVYGKPKAALNTDGRVARNLIPNSVLIHDASRVQATVADTSATTNNVAQANSTQAPVVSNGIPATPTH